MTYGSNKDLILTIEGMLNTRLIQCNLKLELHNDSISYKQWEITYSNFYEETINHLLPIKK